MTAPLSLRIGAGGLRPDLDADTLFLRVADVVGDYTLPYIQSSPHLAVASSSWAPGVSAVRLKLSADDRAVAEHELSPAHPRATFANLPPSEYRLIARGYDASGREVSRQAFRRIAIGTVIAALGDSITEGYFGRGFMRPGDLRLHAGLFPPDSVSRDGRNFPQYSPTTAQTLPEVNSFQSWMTELNDLLAASWHTPVFIANEGWGGYQSADYLSLMRSDHNWQARMRFLQPQVWLIHLGVNDERALVPARAFAANLEAIVRILLDDYGARSERILIARPCYDFFDGAAPYLQAYCAEIAGMVERLRLSHGADFFAAYSRDRERYYGEDPVHPNVAGMTYMAHLWHDAIVRALPGGALA